MNNDAAFKSEGYIMKQKKIITIVVISLLSLMSIGCDNSVPDSVVEKYKERMADQIFYEFLFNKYKKNGSDARVYGNFDPFQGERSIFSPMPEFLRSCLEFIPISNKDIDGKKSLIYRKKEYSLKDGAYNFDRSQFVSCAEQKLNDIALNYDNLYKFSENKEIKEYKEKVPSIASLIDEVKEDGRITVGEALAVYLAVYKAKEENLFDEI